MIVMCSACGRVKVRPGFKWDVTCSTFWARPADKDPSQPDAISHDLCPECAAEMEREIDPADAICLFCGARFPVSEGGESHYCPTCVAKAHRKLVKKGGA